jgi:hypothetical protein
MRSPCCLCVSVSLYPLYQFLNAWTNLYEIWYCHVYQWLETGFGLVIGFINNLQVVTTINYNTIADLLNLQSLHTNFFSLAPLVFTDL